MGRCQTHTKANLNKLPLLPNRENLIAVTHSGKNQQMPKPEGKRLVRIRIFTLSQSTTARPHPPPPPRKIHRDKIYSGQTPRDAVLTK